jgi:hypothetical protein
LIGSFHRPRLSLRRQPFLQAREASRILGDQIHPAVANAGFENQRPALLRKPVKPLQKTANFRAGAERHPVDQEVAAALRVGREEGFYVPIFHQFQKLQAVEQIHDSILFQHIRQWC